MSINALVTGAGGFIGHHMVNLLVERGYKVRGVDVKAPEYGKSAAHEFQLLDLRLWDNCLVATRDVDEIYHLAADMGGIGYITEYHAEVAKNNILMNTHMLDACRVNEGSRFFFSSSACIYPQHLQNITGVTALKESDAYPADAEEGYGWEKLFTEKLCQYYLEDYGLETRVARFHNAYGPQGTYDGGREKAPAAICRKIALAEDSIEVWGDGQQTRSFMYIDDCVEGIYRIMKSEFNQPINLGTDHLVTIDEIVDMVCTIAGKSLEKRYDTTKPQGVRGRNSDNTLLREVLNWTPSISVETGLRKTYKWIEEDLSRIGSIPLHSATKATRP